MKKRIRFQNLFIDSFVFLLVVMLISFLVRDFLDQKQLKIIMLGSYYAYYFLFELLTGQTIGKMITKTTVVTTKGQKPSFVAILIRTLSRLIPIDFISYLFSVHGIHDFLSQTKLVKK